MTNSQREKLLARRPENILNIIGENSQLLVMNSKDIFDTLFNDKLIIMACNARIPLVIPGIMRAAEEMDSIVAFELAKTEANLSGGYTGQTPKKYVEEIINYAWKERFSMPFFIHADHTTVKEPTEDVVKYDEDLMNAQYNAGYTSFAIDASYLELEYNIAVSIRLAVPVIEWGLGLEVEVGEIAGAAGRLTTVGEAVKFIEALNLAGVQPNLLAISNGSKHGNYAPGEEIHIDLERTLDIFNSIRKWNVSIAQHGITGTPLHLMGKFADHGIRKGNVGTIWQNISHKHFPADLFKQMTEWAKINNKDIKYATAQFKKDIDSIPEENKEAIAGEAYIVAKEFFEAFRSGGSATILAEKLTNEP